MAESIIIHFSDATVIEKLEFAFDAIGKRIDDTWSIPSNSNYKIMIYLYDDYVSEYDESEKGKVVHVLGCTPKISYCFELRRSCQNEACDISKNILTEELSKFNYIVDDCIDKIWTKAEITEHKDEFLKEYYYKKSI